MALTLQHPGESTRKLSRENKGGGTTVQALYLCKCFEAIIFNF